MLHTMMVGSKIGGETTGTGMVEEGGVETEDVGREWGSVVSLLKGMSNRLVLGLYSGSTQ
jgi:hypothetical protein